VEAGFTAGQVSSDGGAFLLRKVDRKINLLGRLGAVSATVVTRPASITRCPNSWRSASTGWRWATKT
jgi:hypothetical protein